MVDIVHHALIGLGGSLALNACGQTDAAAGFLLGSILPDLDAAFMVLGKDRYLRLHQGITHSFLLLPVISLGLGLAMAGLGVSEAMPLALGAGAGMLLHVCLDALNTFGVRLFWPSQQRVAFDAFFFVDAPLLALTLAVDAYLVLVAPTPEASVTAALAWLLATAAYALARRGWSAHVRRRLGAQFAIPDAIDPLGVHLTWVGPDAIETAYASGWRGVPRNVSRWPTLPRGTLGLCRGSPTFRNLEASLRLFVPVSPTDEGGLTTVVSRCLAVRNFDNRYGEIRQTFRDGKQESEHARL